MSNSTPSKLLRPKLKKGFRPERVGLPFPNFSLAKDELPSICRCIFDGDSFYVVNEQDIHILHRNGSFGVSSLTFREPSSVDPDFCKRTYYAKQIARNCQIPPDNAKQSNHKLKNSLNCSTTSNSSFSFKKPRIDIGFINNANGSLLSAANGNGFVAKSSCSLFSSAPVFIKRSPDELSFSKRVIKDINCDFDEKNGDSFDGKIFSSVCPNEESLLGEIYSSMNINEERLILMPEEAIFLSFGVGCLTIHSPRGEVLGYRTVWRRLVESNPEFPISYAVYHYFRAKNWVPKIGDSYGASYVLYQVGPSVHHSTYIVHILGFPSRPTPTWTELSAWVRLATHVSKNVLVCEVSLPLSFNPESSEPRSIFQMSLKETSIFRWIPKSDGVEKSLLVKL